MWEQQQQPKVGRINRIYEQLFKKPEDGRTDGWTDGQLLQMFTEEQKKQDSLLRTRETTNIYRRLRCTRQRMQLVVMAAVLAVVGAGQDCSLRCHLTDIRIPVEGCNQPEFIDTTICEGQCDNKDPSYILPHDWHVPMTCNGDWSYELIHIEGCPVISYPVATNCNCTKCNADGNTNCESFPGDVTGCPSS